MLTKYITKWLIPVATKVSESRHLVAIRDAFIDIMPIIMVNSLFILLNSLVFTNATVVKAFPYATKLVDIGTMVNQGTMGIMTILVSFLIGYRLTNFYIANGRIDSKEVNPLHAGILSLATTLIMFPLYNDVIPVGGH